MSAESQTRDSAIVELDIARLAGRTIGIPGRYLLSARTDHFVSDLRASAGGPGEAVRAAELLIGALVACALSSVEGKAGELGLVLEGVTIEASATRDPDDGTRYSDITLTVTIVGPDREVQQSLVDAFVATCPIYNTIRRGGPISVTLAAA